MFTDTPIEPYEINGRTVFVKREDLCINSNKAPKLAKLRGIYFRLLKLRNEGIKILGVTDTRISKSGWGVSYLVQEFKGMKVFNFYPKLKHENEIPYNQQQVLELDQYVYDIPATRTGIVYAHAKQILKYYENSYMLPLGLVVPESVDATMAVAEKIPEQYLGGDLIIPVGSGMTILGVSLAIAKYEKNIYGISAGMSIDNQIRRILKIAQGGLPSNVELILPEGVGYYDTEMIETPFPSSIYYDKKAYRWMINNLDKLNDPILFWNIGV